MSDKCITRCNFYSHCSEIVRSHSSEVQNRNPIAEKLGLYAAEDHRAETAWDLKTVADESCRSNNPGNPQTCMIVATAAVKAALK